MLASVYNCMGIYGTAAWRHHSHPLIEQRRSVRMAGLPNYCELLPKCSVSS